MKQDEWRDKWHHCDLSMMKSLSGVTDTPGQVYEVLVSNLNINLQKMPGIESVYLSGYIIPQDEVPSDLTPLGEFVLLREDDDTYKTYNYAFTESGGNYYFNGPYKYFDDHHTSLSGAVNIDNCFGNVPQKDENNE